MSHSYILMCQSAFNIAPLSASKNDPQKVKKKIVSILNWKEFIQEC